MPRIESRQPEAGASIPRRGLIASAAWSHRWGVLAWIAGGGGFLLYFGVAYAASVGSYKGGAAAFGLAAAPVAEAMRPLTGMAERLDTYGGYVTYHNAAFAALLLALWAAIQGAQAIRGWEERGGAALWLATGKRRWRMVLDQWTGELIALVAIAIGVGAALGAGAAIAGQPNWAGAAAVAVELALVAATFFAVALLISQLTGTARAGAGLTTFGMVVLYLGANMSSELGWFAWIRFLSPFFYFQQSRAMVPGHSLDLVATLVLVATSIVPVVAAAAAFERRDLGASLLVRRSRGLPPVARVRPIRLGAFWQRDAWLADLRAQWISLAFWFLGSATTMFLIVSAAKGVTEIWQSSDLVRQLFVRIPGATFTDQYMTYVTIVAAVAPAAFAVSEAARWVGDLSEGRAETVLSMAGWRPRVVLEWAMSAAAGIVIVVAGTVAGALAGALAAGVELRADSLVRTASDAILLGAGISGAALLAVAVFRNGIAVGALGAALGAGFFVSILGPMFKWPDWVVRLSPFEAFGTPYSTVPRPGGMALLAGLALVGGMLSGVIAQRRSSLT